MSQKKEEINQWGICQVPSIIHNSINLEREKKYIMKNIISTHRSHANMTVLTTLLLRSVLRR